MLGLHHGHRAAGEGQHRSDLSLPTTRRAWLAAALAACAFPRFVAASDWQARLAGDTVALLGEVHDNAALQRDRLRVLRRAVQQAGWRPALAMEQFDLDRQADIERARRERPRDAQHLVDVAAAHGWDWDYYRPLVALALEYELPLLAANLPNATARRLVREGYVDALGAARARDLRLVGPRAVEPDAAWRGQQQDEIASGHCGRLPASLLPGMARAQFARDAAMAAVIERAAAPGRGVVLLAGNGHARRDIGVPRWLLAIAPARRWSVGFVEADSAESLRPAFDALVVEPAAQRDDPCARVAAPKP